MSASKVLTLRDLNRATLHRQRLLERADGPVSEVVGRLAGLQAQHATWPYVALWSRRHTAAVSELEAALADGAVIRATVMRTTLHLVDAADARTFDVLSAQPRLATWQPSAARAGLDLVELNAEVRAFCREPRTVAEIEARLGRLHPEIDPSRHIPGGVRNAWFRLGTAAGGLVHVPPSGFWGEHGKPSYVALDVRVPGLADPTPEQALRTGIERFLAAYGPATAADFMQWSGQRRIGIVRAALKSLGDRIVELEGPGPDPWLDLAGLETVPADAPPPRRFLARWDSALIAYGTRARARLVDPAHTAAVYKKNGDVLPTFLIDGQVAGLWSTETADDRAILTLEPFAKVGRKDRAALTEEADRLLRYLSPTATTHKINWSD
ncbi:winged helix DNA-binding domain-containing protein [Microlunatus speluncae]|uniref:winged helix DNA-binding domain-containing protein n=1 Tax=Microlunatus speluncae TaxID=2594267 RepID=UPI001266532A|nr:winged helix DNA-binding domain-containing protein [Microlunatus speluncae]